MDSDISKSLKKALELVKSGNLKEARPILVEILKKDSEIEQAWYMLSFVVPNHERQVYAIKHALRLNPDSAKYRERLEKLSGSKVQVSPEPIVENTPQPFVMDEEARPTKNITSISPEPTGQSDDLLSQRLFGSSSKEDSPPAESLTPATQEVVEAGNAKSKKKRKSKKPKKDRTERKGSRTALILLVLIIVLGGGFYFIDPMNLFGPNGDNDSVAENSTETPTDTMEPTITVAVSTDTPTPTVTMSPTIINTSTSVPTRAPTATEILPELNAEAQATLESIQNQIEQIRGLESTGDLESFNVSQEKLKSVLDELFSGEEFDHFTRVQKSVYTALGLTDPAYDFESHYKNLWGDLYGSVFSPKANMIFLTGFGIGPIQQNAFAQEFAMSLLEDQYFISGLGAFPTCELTFQECQAFMALIKGDSLLVSERWFNLNLSGEDKQKVLNQVTQPFIISNQIPPVFVVQDLLFPNEYGLEFVKVIYGRGGWTAVNDMYLAPPLITEQIMHPEKYSNNDEVFEIFDVPLSEILDEEWTEVFDDSIGEWTTYLMLAFSNDPGGRIDSAVALDAAEGWGGDQTQIYTNEFGSKFVSMIHWVWDTPLDAENFSLALTESQAGKNSLEEPIEVLGAICFDAILNSTCILTLDSEVILIQGPTLDIIENIIEFNGFE